MTDPPNPPGSSPPPPSDPSPPDRGGLRPEEIARLIAELATVLREARLEKVYDATPPAFRLRFRTTQGRRDVLFSTRRGLTRFHLVEPRGAPTNAPSPGAMELRALLGGARVVELDQPGGDRVARVRFARGPREAPKDERSLILEVFGPSGRLLVIDEESRKVRFHHGRGGLSTGDRYRFPDPPPRPSGETWTIPFDPASFVPDRWQETEAPFHHFLEARMHRDEVRQDRSERRRDVTTRLRREAKRRRQLTEKLRREREQAERWETWQRQGELLKAELGSVRRGQRVVEVTDWYDPETPRIEIALDPTVGPMENVERLFRRARKGKRSLEPLVERLGGLEEALTTIESLREEIEAESAPFGAGSEDDGADRGSGSLPDDPADAALTRAEEWLSAHGRARRGRGRSESSGRPERGGRRARDGRRGAGRGAPGKGGDRPSWRRYRTREGLEVLAGRNARRNDELSIRVARGNDLFFHRADRPGPHVIVRVPRGRTASPESIDDAAFIAAYLSGWRGPSDARVHWTEAKHVRKPKGLPPGRVLAHRTREHRVRFDRDRIGGLSAASDAGGAPGGAP